MAETTDLPRLIPRKHSEDEKDAPQAATRLLTERLEDQRMAERIERGLGETGYGALRAIEVSVNTRVVVLLGRVPSYYLKQIAQEIALAIPGAHQIHNGLDVVPPN